MIDITKIKTFTFKDLVGKTLKITSTTDLNITLIFAQDIDTKIIYLLENIEKENTNGN